MPKFTQYSAVLMQLPPCPCCTQDFVAGDEWQIVSLDPADAENARRARMGLPHLRRCCVVHLECVPLISSLKDRSSPRAKVPA